MAESATRGGNDVFTTPPALVGNAQSASGPFKDRASPQVANSRALLPTPSLTMHVVIRNDSGVKSFTDLAGKNLLIGKGSFGASEGAKYLELFGLKDKVTLPVVAYASTKISDRTANALT